MTPSFSDVMKLTSTISIHTVFSEPECRAYYDLIRRLDESSAMAEIGVQYGRSSSIALQLQPYLKFRYLAVDPFVDGEPVYKTWYEMTRKIHPEVTFTVAFLRSKDAIQILTGSDLLLVDGDHSRDGILIDCDVARQTVKSGGYVLYHDYGWSSTPEVKEIVDQEMRPDTWQFIGVHDTLAIFRRL